MHTHFTKLKVWGKSVVLTKKIYQITKKFPSDERFGLCVQMQRAAVSIPSNIAEGNERKSLKDFSHFLLIAKGSVAELQTQLFLAHELHYIDRQTKDRLWNDAEEISRMLFAFHSTLVTRHSSLKVAKTVLRSVGPL